VRIPASWAEVRKGGNRPPPGGTEPNRAGAQPQAVNRASGRRWQRSTTARYLLGLRLARRASGYGGRGNGRVRLELVQTV